MEKIKQKYGEFENVLLSDSEIEKLKKRYPELAESYIEKLDLYLESMGKKKKYASHYATILNWIRRDIEADKKRSNRRTISRPATYDLAALSSAAKKNTEIKYR